MASSTRFDNSPSSATNLGNLSKSISARGSLSSDITNPDFVDYLKFKLTKSTGRSRVSIALSGLKSNADLALVDSEDNPIASSSRSGKKSESIKETLTPGTYFVRVGRAGQDVVNTKYKLKISAKSVGSDPGSGGSGGNGGNSGGNGGGNGGIQPITLKTDPGSTMTQAYDIKTLTAKKSYRNTVGSDNPNDPIDFYRFSVNAPTRVNINVGGGTTADLIYDLNGDGLVSEGTTKDILGSGQSIEKALGKGTYFIRVTPSGGSQVTYDLTLTPTAISTARAGTTGSTPFISLTRASNLGAITPGASRTIKQIVGSTNSTDVYKFTLTAPVSVLSALVNSKQKTGDVTVSLIYDDDNRDGQYTFKTAKGAAFDGDNGIANPGKLNEQGLVVGGNFFGAVNTGSSNGGSILSLTKTLGAGIYYLAVTQNKIVDNSTYNLDLFVNSGLVNTTYDGDLYDPNSLKNLTPGNASDPGSTMASAFTVPFNNASRALQTYNYKQFVGAVDSSDFYKFTLTQARNVIITYNGTDELAGLRFGQDTNGNGRFDKDEVLKGDLAGDVVYNPLPPFFDNGNAKFNDNNFAFTTTVPVRIYTRLNPGTYYFQVDPQATSVDLGDGLTRYGSANILYNLSFVLDA